MRRLELPPADAGTRIQVAGWFRDALYVGFGRPGGADAAGTAQVWRYLPGVERWERVYEADADRGRAGAARGPDRSIRACAVCRSSADEAPALYLGIGAAGGRSVFLRCADGSGFEEGREQGFGIGVEGVPPAGSIACLDGRVFSTPAAPDPIGAGGDDGPGFPLVFASDDPLRGRWMPTHEPGFGDADNLAISALATFADHLYAATVNERRGFQLWKCRPEGRPPYRWEKVLEHGAWRPVSAVVPAMHVFADALYVTGALPRQGGVGRDRFGPYPAEMIRVHADDRWDLVSGQPRFTPHGYKRPTSRLLGGFGDYFTHLFWSLAEYDGWLYCGTAGWKWLPVYLEDRDDLSPEKYAWLREETARHRPGEFALWRSRDGDAWEAVTETGLAGGDARAYGVRDLVATPAGLFLFTACEAGADEAGHAELWLAGGEGA